MKYILYNTYDIKRYICQFVCSSSHNMQVEDVTMEVDKEFSWNLGPQYLTQCRMLVHRRAGLMWLKRSWGHKLPGMYLIN
jgi:hypothetical protein